MDFHQCPQNYGKYVHAGLKPVVVLLENTGDKGDKVVFNERMVVNKDDDDVDGDDGCAIMAALDSPN